MATYSTKRNISAADALPTTTMFVNYLATSVFDMEQILADAPFTRAQITDWYVKYDTLYIYWTDANGEEQCEEYEPDNRWSDNQLKHPHEYRDADTGELIDITN